MDFASAYINFQEWKYAIIKAANDNNIKEFLYLVDGILEKGLSHAKRGEYVYVMPPRNLPTHMISHCRNIFPFLKLIDIKDIISPIENYYDDLFDIIKKSNNKDRLEDLIHSVSFFISLYSTIHGKKQNIRHIIDLLQTMKDYQKF